MITDKLSKYLALTESLGWIPSTIGVSDEEYDEYIQILKETAEASGFKFTDTLTKPRYFGIELIKYGKKNKE